MLELIVAVLIGLCTGSGVLLRYEPFAVIATDGQKRLLRGIYTATGILYLLVTVVLLRIFGLAIAIPSLQIGGAIYGVVLSVVNMIVIPGKTREHLFVLGVVLTCHYLLFTIPAYTVSIVELGQLQNLLVYIGIYGGLLVVAHRDFSRLLRRTVEPFLHMHTGDYWQTISFVPVVYFAAVVIFAGSQENVDRFLQLVSSIFSMAMMLLLCRGVNADYRRLRERQAMEQQLANQKLHYAELKIRVEDARKTKHDFKHHIAAIRHYLEIDDKEGLRRYCDDLSQRTVGEGSIPYTGNAAADGVLYHYMQMARQRDIQFRYVGAIHSQGIADIDLCVLLGNALDNAMTACMTISEGRSISVISQSESRLLSIVIHNTFDGKVEQSGGSLLSRKRENRQGVGLASMRSIVERCGGSMDVQWDGKVFTVILMLPLE